MIGRLFAGAVVVLIGGLLFLAAGARAPSRPLSFEQGVFKGQKLPVLSENQKRELRDRGGLLR